LERSAALTLHCPRTGTTTSDFPSDLLMADARSIRIRPPDFHPPQSEKKVPQVRPAPNGTLGLLYLGYPIEVVVLRRRPCPASVHRS
jgi:hypothetical protein